MRYYRLDLSQFPEYWERHKAGESLEAVTYRQVRPFLARALKGRRRTTVARKLSSLRTFFKYLQRQGLVEVNPARLAPSPKLEKALPRFLSVDEAFHLLSQPEREGDFLNQRDRAILEIFYAGGLRLSELAGLSLDDVNLKDGVLKVFGKGAKERLTFLGRPACLALAGYLSLRQTLARQKGVQENALFLNKQGTRLSTRGVARVVVAWARKAGLPGGLTPHGLIKVRINGSPE